MPPGGLFGENWTDLISLISSLRKTHQTEKHKSVSFEWERKHMTWDKE